MMNRGVLQNSSVQQMMAAGNQSSWPNINNFMRPPILSSSYHHHQQHFLSPSPNNSYNDNTNNNNNNNNGLQAHYTMNMPVSSSWLDDHPTIYQEQHQQHPDSWIQLLEGVLLGGNKKMDTNNWEEQDVLQQQEVPHYPNNLIDVKQESSVNSNNNNNSVYSTNQDQEFQLAAAKVAALANWSHNPQLSNIIPVSSPQSCVTSFSSSNNLLDFSSSISSDNLHSRNPPPAPDRSFECNSTATGGAAKKAKVQPSSSQSTTLKVRKEKLGDRITALHQLVSPFGKTDTASVLLEAIGYIRFLQSQIEALSLPYLNNGAGNKRQPQPLQAGERKGIFPEDPGQLLNDNCLKRKGGPDQDSSYEEPKDLRSRGLCLVPVSCTMHVGSDNGADYWAPALGGGGGGCFR